MKSGQSKHLKLDESRELTKMYIQLNEYYKHTDKDHANRPKLGATFTLNTRRRNINSQQKPVPEEVKAVHIRSASMPEAPAVKALKASSFAEALDKMGSTTRQVLETQKLALPVKPKKLRGKDLSS